jgi:superfamily I DNA/RNA helicase
MLKSNEILDFLKQHKGDLETRFSVRSIGLFGSVLRGSAIGGSDVDILVELAHPTFDHYMDLKFFLEDHLGWPVDLVLADETSNDKNGVSLMTIHKAKGLEFPVVFVTGLIDGMLPHKNGDIEEERRIAFVGISRAMRQLYLTYASTYAERPVKRSPFLEEMFSGEC